MLEIYRVAVELMYSRNQINRTGSTLFIVRTDSHEIICPVKDRLTRNYIPCLEQRVLACVAPIASQFHSACLRAPTQYCA